MRVLLKFNHGLGDAMQLNVVLKHLAKHFPSWIVDVYALHGKHSAVRGSCSMVFSDRGEQPREGEYDRIISLSWFECHRVFEHVPSTKPALCLAEVFSIEPDPDLFYYSIRIPDDAHEAAEAYLRDVTQAEPKDGRFPAVVIHYQGNTSADKKNLPHDAIAEVCKAARANKLVPVILDWDKRTPLADGKAIFCPDSLSPLWGGTGTGDAGVIAALIEQSTLMIGIDSGPLHVAAACSTPTVGVWTGHLPTRYIDRADNVLHLVPPTWRQGMAEDQARVFEKYYRFRERTSAWLGSEIISTANEVLGTTWELPPSNSLVTMRGFSVRKNAVSQDLTIVEDVYYRDSYKLNAIPHILGQAKTVVDVGAHIGSFARLVHDRTQQARIICIEACPENIDALRANAGDFTEVIHGACTYEPGDIGLLNSVQPQSASTGGSVVVRAAKLAEPTSAAYWADSRPLPKVTLEGLWLDRIDVLKLDCESSEYSILEHCDLSKVGVIVGEYHEQERWDRFREGRFDGWKYVEIARGNDSGSFHLYSPRAVEMCSQYDAETVEHNKKFLQQLRSTAYDRNYYEEHRAAGLDYLGHGDWQRAYGRWLARSMDWIGKRVLDVGCACGSLVRGLGEAGIVVNGIDLSEHMIQLGRQQWPDMSLLLHVGDAINMHMFPDRHWDGIHTGQVAEHWKPKLVPFILEELARVTVPGGLLFFALDTTELFARQQRTMDNEDPTHICVQPMSWWYDQLEKTGWQVCSHEYEQALLNDQESYLRQYDWDWFVARKVVE